MTKSQGKKGLVVTIIVLALTILVIGGIAVAMNWQKPADETSTETTETVDEEAIEEEIVAEEEAEQSETPVVDPSTLNSIDIEPLKISVFYTKGTPGFEFSVLRTTDGTQYVTFSAPALVGTKCTDDTGVFASIIKSPTLPDQTISQTVSVNEVTYGLSLAGKNCTADVALLDKYQAGFVKGFSTLEATE